MSGPKQLPAPLYMFGKNPLLVEGSDHSKSVIAPSSGIYFILSIF